MAKFVQYAVISMRESRHQQSVLSVTQEQISSRR